MRAKNELLMRELRRIDPLGSGKPGRARDEIEPDEELLRTILATSPTVRSAAKRRGAVRPAGSRRRLLAPAAIATAAAVVLAISLVGGADDEGRSLGVLDQVALAAAAQPAPIESTERYTKKRVITMDTAIAGGESWSVYTSELHEEWRSESGAGRLRVVAAPPQFVGPGDRAAWEAAGSPNFLAESAGETSERSLPAESDSAGVSTLPTEPVALYEELSRRAVEIDNSVPLPMRTLVLIGDLLQNPAATPGLRAALYRSAERIPGIQSYGRTEDQIGRAGVAIGLESGYSGAPTRYELIFDPESSEVFATTSIALEPGEFADASPPFPLESTLFLESRP